MPDEPGFTVEIVVAGQVITLKTSAADARKEVQRYRDRGFRLGDDPGERLELHAGLAEVVGDVLLNGAESIRTFVDADGRIWKFRGELIGAVAVIDDAGGTRRQAGFQLDVS